MEQNLSNMTSVAVSDWTSRNAGNWAKLEGLSDRVIFVIHNEEIDGFTLLTLCENDIRDLPSAHHLNIGERKRFWIAVRRLQKENQAACICLGLSESTHVTSAISAFSGATNYNPYHVCATETPHVHEMDRISPPLSIDGRASSIKPEVFKTAISLGYAFAVTWITAFVMVVVHERVPDMKRYPPLPDIFLDNVPHIPWAFHMCEFTGTLLFGIWCSVCIVHKHRLVLLRRFFALAGTVFLLRCVTMLITSLSVPGTHLQCNPNDYTIDDTNLTVNEAFILKVSRAYTIWSGLGMSIQGVRTCGDYMFSGHTVALTLLNFFITEYTPRNLYFLHTLTWLLNMFGIFFILAAHEHYSIDVFVAFYISSRLFLYYHTLANNQALMSHDSNRTRIWFPMFSYFESSVDGIIPNEYDTVDAIFSNIFKFIVYIKDSFMLTARRYWITSYQMNPLPKNQLRQSMTNATAQAVNTLPLQTPQNSLNSMLTNLKTNNLSENNKSIEDDSSKRNINDLGNGYTDDNIKIAQISNVVKTEIDLIKDKKSD